MGRAAFLSGGDKMNKSAITTFRQALRLLIQPSVVPTVSGTSLATPLGSEGGSIRFDSIGLLQGALEENNVVLENVRIPRQQTQPSARRWRSTAATRSRKSAVVRPAPPRQNKRRSSHNSRCPLATSFTEWQKQSAYRIGIWWATMNHKKNQDGTMGQTLRRHHKRDPTKLAKPFN